MAISNVLTSMAVHLSNAYDAVGEKGGAFPQAKNLENLASAISTIPQGGGSTDDSFARLIENKLSYLENSDVKFIPSFTLAYRSIDTVSFPNCSTILSNGFQSMASIKNYFLPNCYYIDQSAFYSNRSIISISIPMVSSTYDGYSANIFNSCTNLTSIYAPRLQVAGHMAFCYCSKLSEINLPECRYLSSYAFQQNSILTSVSLPNVRTIGDYAFANCSKLEDIEFPLAYSASSNCLGGCFRLKTVSLPVINYLPYSNMFNGCFSLASISLPACISLGASSTFMQCSNLSAVYLFNYSYMTIAANLFRSTPMSDSTITPSIGWGSIYVPAGALSKYQVSTNPYSNRITALSTDYDSIYAYGYEFYNKSQSVDPFTEIPSEKLNVKYVCPYAFASCWYLSEINLPECESVHTYAFSSCFRVSSVSLPKVKYIGSYAFNLFISSNLISRIDLPECRVIDAGAFIGNSYNSTYYNLTSISLPKVEYVGSNAFNGQTKISGELFLPECKAIYSNAFTYCYSLSTINLPKCEVLNTYVFSNCSNLASVIAPNLYWIDMGAFQSARSLLSINLPNVIIVRGYAFNRCTNLSTVSFPNCILLDNQVFAECGNTLKSVYIPKCMSLGTSCFYDCGLEQIYLPECSYIGSSTFYYCNHLQSAYLFASSVATLANVNAFYSTKIDAGLGSIYVPASLISQYQEATNWAAYSERFVGMTDAEMNAIRHQYEGE